MDVILEVLDTFFFDRVYATLLPIHPSVSSFDPLSTIAASLKATFQDANASWATNLAASQPPVGELVRSAWQYTPASDYFGVAPSEYAYMSRWDRDNIFRQSVSLFLVET